MTGTILDLNYRVGTRVGWPYPSDDGDLTMYERVAGDAREYRKAGFTAIQFPPSTVGGAGIFSDGYDKYDDYGFDGTAYGDGDQLHAAIHAIHQNSMQAYADLVIHQMGGGAGGYYRTEKFPKQPSCFVGQPPRVAQDEVPDNTGNTADGDMISYTNSLPKNYMWNNTIAAVQEMMSTYGFDGARIDNAKGTSTGFQQALTKALINYFLKAEYYDGNPEMVSRYVFQLMKGIPKALDFAFKFNVGNICNNNSRVWMGTLSNVGWCMENSAEAVTFVESADTDNGEGTQTIWNKELGYAIGAVFPGYLQVYYRDWSSDPECFNLKGAINNLLYIRGRFANGSFVPRIDTDFQTYAAERLGTQTEPGCVAVFNNDQYNEYTRTILTSVGPYQRMHNYTPHGEYNDVWTDKFGQLTCKVPRNNNGQGYMIFGKAE